MISQRGTSTSVPYSSWNCCLNLSSWEGVATCKQVIPSIKFSIEVLISPGSLLAFRMVPLFTARRSFSLSWPSRLSIRVWAASTVVRSNASICLSPLIWQRRAFSFRRSSFFWSIPWMGSSIFKTWANPSAQLEGSRKLVSKISFSISMLMVKTIFSWDTPG